MNPNESIYSGATSKKSYYGIDGEGRLFRKATDLEIAAKGISLVEHVKLKGVNEGETVFRTLINNLNGVVSAIYLKNSPTVGDSLVVELYKGGYFQVLEVSFNGDFASDILKKLPNLLPAAVYTFQSWKMQAKTREGKVIKDKFVRGVSIKEGDIKIEKFLTKEREQVLVPLHSISIYDPTLEVQASEFWKMYYSTLSFVFKTRLLPKYQKAFSDWADGNIKGDQQLASGNVTAALLPQTFTADRPQYEPQGTTNTKLELKGDESWMNIGEPPPQSADSGDELPF